MKLANFVIDMVFFRTAAYVWWMLGPVVPGVLASSLSNDDEWQPSITLVSRRPQRKTIGGILRPQGSPWCDGNATIWPVGHTLGDTPNCYNPSDDFWSQSRIAVLDAQDELNAIDGPNEVDRHDCAALDVNGDGVDDVVCVVGANIGRGRGYNELYFTQPDGSLRKVLRHGLQKYPTVRTRLVATLRNRVENVTMLLVAARSQFPRHDGAVNDHRMFRVARDPPYFHEIMGPWSELRAKAEHLTVADWNGDGRDDLVICNERRAPVLYEQRPGRKTRFRAVQLPDSWAIWNTWRSSRVADVNGDGIADLIVTTYGRRGPRNTWFSPRVRVFNGTLAWPRFDFSTPYYQLHLPHAAPDVEVVDAKQDGVADLYVVQMDERTRGSYCAEGKPQYRWGGGPHPPYEWLAPFDPANDLLLLGNSGARSRSKRFTPIAIRHHLRGCGYYARTFGNNNTVVLARGDFDHPGDVALVRWPAKID